VCYAGISRAQARIKTAPIPRIQTQPVPAAVAVAVAATPSPMAAAFNRPPPGMHLPPSYTSATPSTADNCSSATTGGLSLATPTSTAAGTSSTPASSAGVNGPIVQSGLNAAANPFVEMFVAGHHHQPPVHLDSAASTSTVSVSLGSGGGTATVPPPLVAAPAWPPGSAAPPQFFDLGHVSGDLFKICLSFKPARKNPVPVQILALNGFQAQGTFRPSVHTVLVPATSLGAGPLGAGPGGPAGPPPHHHHLAHPHHGGVGGGGHPRNTGPPHHFMDRHPRHNKR